jgi:hypothetical protein
MFMPAAGTTNKPDISVQFDDVAGSGGIMKAIDILGDQRELVRTAFHRGQSLMPGIGSGVRNMPAPFFVPLPDEFRIAREPLGRCQILKTVRLPKATI